MTGACYEQTGNRSADVSTSNSSRTFIPRLAPLLSIFFLILVGALAIPRGGAQDRYQDHDRDHDRDRDGFIRVSRDQFDRDFGGGRGGRPSPDAQCELGSVAVGFHVQTGEYSIRPGSIALPCVPKDGSATNTE